MKQNEDLFLVTIVVPVFNASLYLDDCLKSITNQLYKNIEIIIINDGSTDDSLIKLQRWAEKDKRIQVIDQHNHGVSFSRNIGISKAKGDFISFIDADDIIKQDYVSSLLNFFTKSDVDCVTCNIASLEENKKKFENSKYRIEKYDKNNAISNLFGVLRGFMANKMYRMSIIKENQLQLNEDVSISEDLLFNFDFFQKSRSIVYSSKVEYLYRQHAASAVNDLYNIKWFSVLDTMNILLKRIELKSQTWSEIAFVYSMLVYQAKYRLKYCSYYSSEILNKIILGETFTKIFISKCSVKQRIKIYLIKYFPSIVMKYKRRKLL